MGRQFAPSRACMAGGAADRFADVEELIHVLESGSAAAVPPRRALSLMERDPARFWQAVSAGLFILLLVSWMVK